jgi:HK97 family phage major capsid protein
MRLSEMQARQDAIRSELAAMDADPETTEERDGNIRDTLIEEWESLEEDKKPILARMEKINLIRRAGAGGAPDPDDGAGDGTGFSPGFTGFRDGVSNGNGNGSNPAATAAQRFAGGRTPEFMMRVDPFQELDKVRDGLVRGSDMVARSMALVEMHHRRGMILPERAEEATRKFSSDPMIARHALLTGHGEYIDAFRAYLNDPMGEGLKAAQRSLTLGTASGGYLLPYVLDPTIVLTSDGSTNPYRQMAEIKTTTSNAWQGVNSAGVQMGWLDEGAQATDNTPVAGQIQIFAKKAAAWVIGSFESVGDTNFADQLPRLLADAKDILEEQAFARGTGGTGNAGQPLGIINSLGTGQKVLAGGSGVPAFTGTAGSGGANGGGLSDVLVLNAALGPRFRMSASVGWVMTITNINRIRAIDQYGGAAFLANLGQGQPTTLLEKQLRESPSLTQTPGTGTALVAASAVFGDWSKFYVVDRIGSTMLFDPLVKSAGTANMPSGNQGWFYYWRVGSGVATPNAFRWSTGGTA